MFLSFWRRAKPEGTGFWHDQDRPVIVYGGSVAKPREVFYLTDERLIAKARANPDFTEVLE